jgi:hypothetical protein
VTAIRERDVERYGRRRAKEVGGEIRKVKWINRAHAPDDAFFKAGTHWIEFKAPGEKPRPGQVREFERMAKQGAPVHVLDTFEAVDKFMGKFA